MERRLGRRDLRFGHCNGRGGDRLNGRIDRRCVDEAPGAREQRIGGGNTDLHVADLRDRIGVVGGATPLSA